MQFTKRRLRNRDELEEELIRRVTKKLLETIVVILARVKSGLKRERGIHLDLVTNCITESREKKT